MKNLIVFIILIISQNIHAQTLEVLKNINTSSTSNPSNFTKLNNKLYFFADDGINGNELWVTDGATANTNMAFNLVPGSAGLNSLYLYKGFNKLYFTNSIGGNDKLYASDGTLANTIALGNFYVGKLQEYAGAVYFIETHFNFTDYEINLYKTDGTLAGTTLVMNLESGFASQPNVDDYEMKVFNNKLYFTGTESATGYNRLAAYDAATNSVTLVSVGATPIYNMYNLHVLGNKLFMVANQEYTTVGNELFVVDASNNVTLVSNINATSGGNSDPTAFYSYANKLYFSANNGIAGFQFYYVDINTTQVFFIGSFSTTGASADNLIAYNGNLYFSAETDTSINFYKLDTLQTVNSLQNLKTIRKGFGYSNYWVATPFIYNGTLHFFASDTCFLNGGLYQPDMQLWQCQGTSASTKPLNIANNTIARYAFNSARSVTEYNGYMYFLGNIDATNNEVVKFTTTPLAISTQNTNNNFAIYPNPFTSNFSIENKNDNTTKAIITNITGNIMLTQKMHVGINNIKMQDAPTGIYLLQLQDAQSKLLGTYKIAKQ